MAAIVIRTAILFFLLSLTLKLMGKRQLGELEVSELVSALLISEVAVLPIDDPDLPLLSAIIPVLCIVSFEILLSYVKNKTPALKRAVDGEPVYIIYKGKLRQRALIDNRLSAEEVLAEMRVLGYATLSEVEYAILEPNGKFSVVPKAQDKPITRNSLRRVDRSGIAHTLIVDGAVKDNTLRTLGYDRVWLQRRLSEQGTRIDRVFLMTVDDEGTICITEKEGK